ncbi:MAG TPA: tetratricopeptide repeat protein [Candidatus Saccharimonadales bacterium]|nr:tetratricopeptide repeat protein [Candidatus Saccharimonadales bacterium]
MLSGDFRERFEELNTIGQAAKDAGDHERALATFEEAHRLATEHDDNLKCMHAITPAARALWSMGRYDDASVKLETASDIARELDLTDELGITISNIGRLATIKTVHTVPVEQQREILRAEAAPKFSEAYNILKDHPHLYYRYANAQHGSVVSAMAGERRLACKLVTEGFRVAFRRSEEPYDQRRTYQINKRGLLQLAAATALIPFADRTPFFAKAVRNKLIR